MKGTFLAMTEFIRDSQNHKTDSGKKMQKIFAEIQKWQSRSNSELRTLIFFPENRLVSSIFCENHRPQSVTVDGWYDLFRPGTGWVKAVVKL